MSLLAHIGHFFRDVGRDIQYRLEGAMMDFSDLARPARGRRSEATYDDVPDLASSMARFERMLRLLEEKRAWPDESLHLEGDEDFDNRREWPTPVSASAQRERTFDTAKIRPKLIIAHG